MSINFTPIKLDLTKTKMYDVWERENLVTHETILKPQANDAPPMDCPELNILAEKIVEAKANKRPIIMFYGAHLIKCGLSLYIIEMIKRGLLTHIASNGAGSIHDFELAYLGGTSEDVPTAIEDGSFGMWEQTGGWMNDAINAGNAEEMGYGEALANYIHRNPDKFSYKDICVFYNAYKHKIPATYHVTIGTDIIHQNPNADFSAIGGASGRDFAIFANSVKDLEGGVFMNVGSAVTGPEVFLKALSICRNQGYKTEKITTANLDLVPLGDYKSKLGYDDPLYYYRPRKNVINRPVSLGGVGLNIQGNHTLTVPNLLRRCENV